MPIGFGLFDSADIRSIKQINDAKSTIKADQFIYKIKGGKPLIHDNFVFLTCLCPVVL